MGIKSQEFVVSLTIVSVLIVIIAFLAILYRFMLGGPDPKWGSEDFTAICVDGIQYYTKTRGYRGFMAVAIDKTTLMPLECKEEGEQYGKE